MSKALITLDNAPLQQLIGNQLASVAIALVRQGAGAASTTPPLACAAPCAPGPKGGGTPPAAVVIPVCATLFLILAMSCRWVRNLKSGNGVWGVANG